MRQHCHRGERFPGNEDSLRVGTQVGRVHEESFGGILGQVVGQDASMRSLSLNLGTHSPSVRGRVVKVFRSIRSASETRVQRRRP